MACAGAVVARNALAAIELRKAKVGIVLKASPMAFLQLLNLKQKPGAFSNHLTGSGVGGGSIFSAIRRSSWGANETFMTGSPWQSRGRANFALGPQLGRPTRLGRWVSVECDRRAARPGGPPIEAKGHQKRSFWVVQAR
jgi:hypothetical protein